MSQNLINSNSNIMNVKPTASPAEHTNVLGTSKQEQQQPRLAIPFGP